MTNPGIIKLVGNTFTVVNTSPTIVPTNAPAGSNANFGGTFSGFGNSTAGGATLFRLLNTTTGLVWVTIANNGTNTGSFPCQSNTDYFFQKYAYDTVIVANTTGGNVTASSVYISPIAVKW